MNTNTTILKQPTAKDTYQMVKELLKGAVDKGGNPYIQHIEAINKKLISKGKDDEYIMVSCLHDMIEDGYLTKEELKELNYPNEVIEAVLLLTRKEGQEYSVYIDNLVNSSNKVALNVKLVDLENNMDLTRLKEITTKDINRLEKRYIPAWKKIKKKLQEIE